MQNAVDPQVLIELVTKSMPFGRHKGTLYYLLPVTYLEWFARKGFPEGKTGMLLQTVHVIKINGLDYLFKGLISEMNKNPRAFGKT